MRSELLITISTLNTAIHELYPNVQSLIRKRPILQYFERQVKTDLNPKVTIYYSEKQSSIATDLYDKFTNEFSGKSSIETNEDIQLIGYEAGISKKRLVPLAENKILELDCISLHSRITASHSFGDQPAQYAIIVLDWSELTSEELKKNIGVLKLKHPKLVLVGQNIPEFDPTFIEYQVQYGQESVFSFKNESDLNRIAHKFWRISKRLEWLELYEKQYVKSQADSFNELLQIFQRDLDKENKELTLKIKDIGTDRAELTQLMRSSAYQQIRKDGTDLVREEIGKFKTNFSNELEDNFNVQDGILTYKVREHIESISFESDLNSEKVGSKVNFSSNGKTLNEVQQEMKQSLDAHFEKTFKELEEIHDHLEDRMTDILNEHELSSISLDPVRSKINDQLRKMSPVSDLRNNYKSNAKYKGSFKDYFNAARSGIMLIMGIVMISSMTSGSRLDFGGWTAEQKTEDILNNVAHTKVMEDAEAYKVLKEIEDWEAEAVDPDKEDSHKTRGDDKVTKAAGISDKEFLDIQEYTGYNDLIKKSKQEPDYEKRQEILNQAEEKNNEAKLLSHKLAFYRGKLKPKIAAAQAEQRRNAIIYQILVYLLVILLLANGVWDFRKQVQEYKEEYEEKETKALSKNIEDQYKNVLQRSITMYRKEVLAHLDEINAFVQQQIDRRIGQVETLNKELEVKGNEYDLQLKVASNREQSLSNLQMMLMKEVRQKILDLHMKLMKPPEPEENSAKRTSSTRTTMSSRTTTKRKYEATARYKRRNA